MQDGESRKKNRKAKNIVGKIRNKTDLARMKEYSSKVWFGTIKKTCIKSYLMYRVFRSFYLFLSKYPTTEIEIS